MPYWTHKQENKLGEIANQGKSLEEIAELFHRSPEAIKLKQPLICQRMREAEEVVEKARQLNDEISV